MENTQPQQITKEQAIENYVLENYAAKKEKGIITHEYDSVNNVVKVIHKQTNNLEEAIEPIILTYRSSLIEFSINNRRNRRCQMEQELIAIEQQVLNKKEDIRQFDLATNAVFPELKADVLALEEKHQPSNPQGGKEIDPD